MKLTILACLLALLACAEVRGAGFLEREVSFSETEIQARLDKSGPQEKHYGGLLSVALSEPPRIRLGQPPGRAGIAALIKLSLPGQEEIPVAVSGSSGIRYDSDSKAFFLDDPVAESVQSTALPPDMEPALRRAVTRLMRNYFRTKPLYVLRDDGPPGERAARWLLRSLRIEPGRVVAVLSPL